MRVRPARGGRTARRRRSPVPAEALLCVVAQHLPVWWRDWLSAVARQARAGRPAKPKAVS
ncbi:predicted protein [Streptomyces lividans TK24]|nr:predicted protein [Streptomyces lividans TK24]